MNYYDYDMMVDAVTHMDTAKLFVLAIGSVVVTHLLLNMLVEKSAIERERACRRQIRRTRLRQRQRQQQRPHQRPHHENAEQSTEEEHTFPPEQETTPRGERSGSGTGLAEDYGRAPANVVNATVDDMSQLRNELQEWLQMEKKRTAGEAKSAETTSIHVDPTARSTSLDALFKPTEAAQSGKPLEPTSNTATTTTPPPSSSSSLTGPHAPVPSSSESRGYENAMNGGALADGGLQAWDSMDSYFAPLSA